MNIKKEDHSYGWTDPFYEKTENLPTYKIKKINKILNIILNPYIIISVICCFILCFVKIDMVQLLIGFTLTTILLK